MKNTEELWLRIVRNHWKLKYCGAVHPNNVVNKTLAPQFMKTVTKALIFRFLFKYTKNVKNLNTILYD